MKTSLRAALIALALFCCVHAFAWTPRLAVAHRFQTPTAAFSLCFTDIGGGGCTVGIELRDANGKLVPFVDAAGVTWPAITLTVPASGSLGLTYGILQTKPDGSNLITAVPYFSKAYVRCLTGTANVPTLAINTGGTTDGSAGTGTKGYQTGWNPNSSTPTQFYVGDTSLFGQGAQQ